MVLYMVLYNTIQCDTTQYNTTQYNKIQCNATKQMITIVYSIEIGRASCRERV